MKFLLNGDRCRHQVSIFHLFIIHFYFIKWSQTLFKDICIVQSPFLLIFLF